MDFVGATAVALSTPFARVVPDGLENIPMAGPAIVAINHTTIADGPIVLSTLRRAGLRLSPPCDEAGCGIDHGHIRFMASHHVIRNPFIGPLARLAGMIEVGGRQAGIEALRAANEALGRGEVVGIYPEGDVSANAEGSPRRFRLGVARLALEAMTQVIPVAHHDARKVGSGSIARSLAGTLTSIVRRPIVRIRVGKPILPAEFDGLPVRDVAELVRQRVSEVWRGIAGAVPPVTDQGTPPRTVSVPEENPL